MSSMQHFTSGIQAILEPSIHFDLGDYQVLQLIGVKLMLPGDKLLYFSQLWLGKWILPLRDTA